MVEFFRISQRTRTTEETAALLSDRYGRVSLDSARVVMSEDHVGDERFTLSQVDLTGAFRASSDISEDFIIVQPLAGSGSWQSGRDSDAMQHTPLLLQSGPPFLTRLENMREAVLMLNPGILEASARALYGDDDLVLRFDADPRPVSARAGARFKEILEMASAARNSMESELVRSSFYQLLAVATLESFRVTGDRRRLHRTATALLHAHQHAVAFIDSSASLPITVLDAAQAAGVPLAQLRAAFRAHSPAGLTPEQYLRRTRLAAAHADLRAADPTRGDTVRAIAIRWGFPHPGAFARHYRTAYGVNPGQTLDR